MANTKDQKEVAADDAIRDTLKALTRASELCEIAGYGSQVTGALEDAHRDTLFALNTALGRSTN